MPEDPGETPAAAVEWPRASHAPLRATIAALVDDELLKPRRANWGEIVETRWLISMMIAHDYYRRGEINHLRALRNPNDCWACEPVG
jgi:hypothetical protein